jgi:hypothetical protein
MRKKLEMIMLAKQLILSFSARKLKAAKPHTQVGKNKIGILLNGKAFTVFCENR